MLEVAVGSTPLVQITPAGKREQGTGDSQPDGPAVTSSLGGEGREGGDSLFPGGAGKGEGEEMGVAVRAARVSDMRQVEPLINAFARRNLMLPKTHDQLARLFREFVVAVDLNGRVVGCGALRVYNESLAEIASLAVDESVHGRGIGRRIVERLVEDGRALGLTTLFALTLQEPFFRRIGFRTVTRDLFPLKVWADCRTCPKLHACDEIAVALEI